MRGQGKVYHGLKGVVVQGVVDDPSLEPGLG